MASPLKENKTEENMQPEKSSKQEMKWIRAIQKKNSAKEADLLIRAYYDEIYVFAYRQLKEKETAMDLTQEIFISMLKSIHNYDRKKASFRTWLYKVAANKIIDFRRKKSLVTIDIDSQEFFEEDDFAEKIQHQELLEKIEKYVSRFETSLQQIYRLRIYGGRSFVEIASILNVPEATVKTRYYRLMKSLRKEFEHEYTDTFC